MLCLKTISEILSRRNLDGSSTLCFTHYSPIPTMGNLCTIVSSVSFAKETFAFVFFLIGSYQDKMTLEGQNGLQVFLQWSMNDRRHRGVGWCSTQLSHFLLKPCRWTCGYFTFRYSPSVLLHFCSTSSSPSLACSIVPRNNLFFPLKKLVNFLWRCAIH